MPNWTRMITPASMQYSRGWLGSCNKECYILSKRNHNLGTFASKQLWPQWRGIRGFLSKSCASCFFDKSYVYLISVLSPSQYMFFHLIVSGITRMSLRKNQAYWLLSILFDLVFICSEEDLGIMKDNGAEKPFKWQCQVGRSCWTVPIKLAKLYLS